ncbi:MAG: hypothetical protein LWX08_04060 [Deltaproteobacteria bacterium]|nr:hypothetical protein [Deltaproteobacteria bacterium]
MKHTKSCCGPFLLAAAQRGLDKIYLFDPDLSIKKSGRGKREEIKECFVLYLGRLQIALFLVKNEHKEQGAKARNSQAISR